MPLTPTTRSLITLYTSTLMAGMWAMVVPTIPVSGLALILGVDRFLAEIRTATNFIGNGVAAVVISRWEGELDSSRLAIELRGQTAAVVD